MFQEELPGSPKGLNIFSFLCIVGRPNDTQKNPIKIDANNFPGGDDVTSPINGTVGGGATAGGSSNVNGNNNQNAQQSMNTNHMNSMYGGNDVHMPPGSANSLVRSQSSGSSGSSSMTGGNGNMGGLGGAGEFLKRNRVFMGRGVAKEFYV
uniref:Uncharacterized protein n=1 Tax=Romanomermis culicivorax TaxID=13658 RepID=A0A915I536_ROMCU